MSDEEDFFSAGEFETGFDADTGKPGIMLVANAIQFWSTQNYNVDPNKCPTVRGAALAFNMTDENVRRAVDAHYWMFVTGPDDDPTKQFIEHEGE